nr:hypothetical protein [Tanacetum cinerariifolium]
SELELHDHNNEQSSSKLVLKVVPPASKTATSRQELELLFHHHITMLRSYALSWKPCQGDSLNLPDHRIRRWCCSLIPAGVRFITTCSCSNYKDILSIKIQESRKLKHKDKDFCKLWYTSFQDDAKYEHVGQDTRSQGGKRRSRQKDKDLKISD